jgi:hypothetical protein
MAKRHVIIVTCEDPKFHPNRKVTVAAFRKLGGKYWSEITPREVRNQYAEGKRSIPELDNLRHVKDDANQQVLSQDRLPWGPNLDKLLANPEQQTEDRLRLDCPLCRKRQTKDPKTGKMITRPNTLVMGPRFSELFDRFADAKKSVVTIDLLRNAYKLL